MKYVVTIVLIVFATNAHAGARGFLLECESINYWKSSSSAGKPLALDESWSLRVSAEDSSAEQYVVTMVKRKRGTIVRGPYQVPVVFRYIYTPRPGTPTGAISISIRGRCPGGACGRLTVNRLAVPFSSEPFIMYGWSTQPLTVQEAMEYRCQIQGVEQP